jgi:hypothetical protein
VRLRFDIFGGGSLFFSGRRGDKKKAAVRPAGDCRYAAGLDAWKPSDQRSGGSSACIRCTIEVEAGSGGARDGPHACLARVEEERKKKPGSSKSLVCCSFFQNARARARFRAASRSQDKTYLALMLSMSGLSDDCALSRSSTSVANKSSESATWQRGDAVPGAGQRGANGWALPRPPPPPNKRAFFSFNYSTPCPCALQGFRL